MAPPKVVSWYRAYCVALAVLYVSCTALGAAAAVFRNEMADEKNPAAGWLVFGLLLAAFGSVFAGVYAAALVLPAKPWVWIYHLVLICGGFTSACCLPVCVPLLIYWIKPDTRAYFGRA